MSASLGFSSSRAKNQSTSDSYGYNTSESGDQSISDSQSVSEGVSSSRQSIAFEDMFQQLYSGATGAANNVAMQAPQLQQQAQQLFTGGSQFLQSLGGNAGTDFQEQRLNSGSQVEDIIGAMKTDAASLFTDKLNPAITSNAVAGGNLGGSRQGIAQGTAQAQVADDFTRNAAALRYQDLQAKDQIAANISGNSIAAANTGLGALPSMLDLLERGQNAELASYSSLASILGGPTTLSESDASNFSNATAQSISDAFSRSFGEQTATAQSTGSSRSRSFSSSFGMG